MEIRKRQATRKQEITWDEFSTFELEKLEDIVRAGIDIGKDILERDISVFLAQATANDVARGEALLAKVEHERNRRRFG